MKRLRMASVVSMIMMVVVLLGALMLATYRRHVVYGAEPGESEEHEQMHKEMMEEMHEH